MRNKRLFNLTAVIITASMLVFTACGSKQEEPEPVISEAVESIEEPEEEEPEETESEESLEDAEKEEAENNLENESDITEEEEVAEEESESDLRFEIIPMDDTTYYATTNCNVRSGPGTTYDVVNGLSFSQGVIVNGRVETADSTWYVIKTDSSEDMQMVSGSLLSTTKPASKSSSTSSGQQSSGSNGGSGQASNGGGSSSSSGGIEVDGNGELPPGAITDFEWGDWGLGGLY